jgi:hypothetical protein
VTQDPVKAPLIPDLVDPVIGFRQWRLEGGKLWPLFADKPWKRGVQTAVCPVVQGHHDDAPPGHACTCGIHAWYRPCPLLGSAFTDLVAGAVAMWGEMELHAIGMRAQHALLIALALPLWHGAKHRRVLEVAAAYDAEAVPPKRLASVALEHGGPIPPEMRPRRLPNLDERLRAARLGFSGAAPPVARPPLAGGRRAW